MPHRLLSQARPVLSVTAAPDWMTAALTSRFQIVRTSVGEVILAHGDLQRAEGPYQTVCSLPKGEKL